jgi:cell fate (sporulation/competence/biofilm development) regulator YlbF (YheA/YmcA/DUF963 family)
MDIDWQLIGVGVGIIITIVVSAIAATEKITRKITKLEGRIKTIEENPLLVAFKKTEAELANALVNMDKIIKGYEEQKVSRKTEEKKEEKKNES